MPPAARVGDMHVCPLVTVLVPHVGGPVLPAGCPTVLIGGSMAARMGDMTAHGGVIVLGLPNVLIGESAQGAALKAAAISGAPFCAQCSGS